MNELTAALSVESLHDMALALACIIAGVIIGRMLFGRNRAPGPVLEGNVQATIGLSVFITYLLCILIYKWAPEALLSIASGVAGYYFKDTIAKHQAAISATATTTPAPDSTTTITASSTPTVEPDIKKEVP